MLVTYNYIFYVYTYIDIHIYIYIYVCNEWGLVQNIYVQNLYPLNSWPAIWPGRRCRTRQILGFCLFSQPRTGPPQNKDVKPKGVPDGSSEVWPEVPWGAQTPRMLCCSATFLEVWHLPLGISWHRPHPLELIIKIAGVGGGFWRFHD